VRDQEGLAVGFCSAVHRPQLGYVYLSRSGVDASARGHGLQRRMIRVRLAWAKRQGAARVITYALFSNHPSIVNLLRCGLQFDTPAQPWVGRDVHYFARQL